MKNIVIVGAGLVGCLTVQQILDNARASGEHVRIHWVASTRGEETHSMTGGLLLPFLSRDSRIPAWAQFSRDYWVNLADSMGWSDYVRDVPTLLVSDQDKPPVIQGHFAEGHQADPTAYGLPYRSGLLYQRGVVLATCKLLDRWSWHLATQPEVQLLPNQHLSLKAINALAENVKADVVYLCTGYKAGDFDPAASWAGLGVLLLASMPKSGIHATTTVMDEDDDAMPLYTIPHAACDHLLIGGTNIGMTQPGDVVGGWRRAFVAELAEGIRSRAIERFPLLEDELRPQLPIRARFRPLRETAHVEDVTDLLGFSQRTIAIHGTGGSGWTIGPGVVRDALRIDPGYLPPAAVAGC